jgi:xanthine dehydrogenase YagS FAD-binding subunit
MHAILGGSDACIAVHPSDMCVALVALDATVRTRGRDGVRTIPFRDLHTVPGDHPEVESVLQPGELVTHIDLAPLPWATRSTYVKVRDRASYAFALASAAVALDLQRGNIVAARVALGGVGTKPWRSVEAETVLSGQLPTVETFRRAAVAALAGAKGRAHNGYKIELAQRTLIRALQIVAGES